MSAVAGPYQRGRQRHKRAPFCSASERIAREPVPTQKLLLFCIGDPSGRDGLFVDDQIAVHRPHALEQMVESPSGIGRVVANVLALAEIEPHFGFGGPKTAKVEQMDQDDGFAPTDVLGFEAKLSILRAGASSSS
jgi:hypothetical protein